MNEEQKIETTEQETSEMPPKKNGNSLAGILGASAAVILLILAGLYMLNQQEAEQPYGNVLGEDLEALEMEEAEDPEDLDEVENEPEELEPEELEPLLEGELEAEIAL
jgi:hypothetical protein